MDLEQIKKNLEDIERLKKALEAEVTGCSVGISFEQDCGWMLFIDYPADTGHADDLSTYATEFPDHEKLRSYLQALLVGAQIANRKEV